MKSDPRMNKEWYDLMFAFDPQWAVQMVKQHGLCPDQHALLFVNYPLTCNKAYYLRFPGAFVIRTEVGSVLLLMNNSGGRFPRYSEAVAFDFDNTLCEGAGDCSSDCTCGEWDEDNEDCAYCSGNCDCRACELPDYYCVTHNTVHEEAQAQLNSL